MMTGFSCAAGYNLVATATRDGRTLLAVVLGRTSSVDRAELAAALLDEGFAGGNPAHAAIELVAMAEPPPDAGPVDMAICTGFGVDRVGFVNSAIGRATVVASPLKVEVAWSPPKPEPAPPAMPKSGPAAAGAGGNTPASPAVYTPPPVLAEMADKPRYRVNDDERPSRDGD
jgi:D-alanyl-D-alanine carboxypeptidase